MKNRKSPNITAYDSKDIQTDSFLSNPNASSFQNSLGSSEIDTELSLVKNIFKQGCKLERYSEQLQKSKKSSNSPPSKLSLSLNAISRNPKRQSKKNKSEIPIQNRFDYSVRSKSLNRNSQSNRITSNETTKLSSKTQRHRNKSPSKSSHVNHLNKTAIYHSNPHSKHDSNLAKSEILSIKKLNANFGIESSEIYTHSINDLDNTQSAEVPIEVSPPTNLDSTNISISFDSSFFNPQSNAQNHDKLLPKTKTFSAEFDLPEIKSNFQNSILHNSSQNKSNQPLEIEEHQLGLTSSSDDHSPLIHKDKPLDLNDNQLDSDDILNRLKKSEENSEMLIHRNNNSFFSRENPMSYSLPLNHDYEDSDYKFKSLNRNRLTPFNANYSLKNTTKRVKEQLGTENKTHSQVTCSVASSIRSLRAAMKEAEEVLIAKNDPIPVNNIPDIMNQQRRQIQPNRVDLNDASSSDIFRKYYDSAEDDFY